VKRTRAVTISPRLLAALAAEATRTHQEVAVVVERAWAAARLRLATLPPPAPVPQEGIDLDIPDPDYVDHEVEALYAARYAADFPMPLTLTLAPDVLEDMIDYSFRIARSIGWLIERAWCIAELRRSWTPAGIEERSELGLLEIEASDTQPMPRAGGEGS
jgi:hypothetical protein